MQAHVVIIVFTTAAAAYGAAAELKRLYTAQTWGEIEVRRVGEHAQMTLPPHQLVPEMTVVGHNTATVRESLLGKVFELGQKWVKAAKEQIVRTRKAG